MTRKHPDEPTYTHGTDAGIPCWRCKGTIWAFGRARHVLG